MDWVRALRTTFNGDETLGVATAAMDNLKGILVKLFGYESIPKVNVISLLAFLVSILFVLWFWSDRRFRALGFDLRMSVTLLVGILFSLHVHPQDGVLLVVPALLFWHHLRRVGRGATLLGSIALMCPPVFWITERFVPTPVLGMRTPAWAMVLLGGWMLSEVAMAGGLVQGASVG